MSDDDESEMLSDRRSPLIHKPATDNFIKVALGAVVALLTFLLGFAYNGNREFGVLTEQVRQNHQATERYIKAVEASTDRRLTVLENRVERIWEESR